MPLRSVEAATRDDAIAAAREQFGPSARVVGVRRVRSGGVLGFFATERYVAEVAPDAGRPAVPVPPPARADDAPLADATPADFSSPLASAAPARARTAPARNGASAWAAEAVRTTDVVEPVTRAAARTPEPARPAAPAWSAAPIHPASTPAPAAASQPVKADEERVSELATLLAAQQSEPATPAYSRASFPRAAAPWEARPAFADDPVPAPRGIDVTSPDADEDDAPPSPFTAALARMVAGDRDVRQAVKEALGGPAEAPWPAGIGSIATAEPAVPPVARQEEEPVDEQVFAPAPSLADPVELPTWAAEPEVAPASGSPREEAIAEVLRAALAQGHSDEALTGILRKVLDGASPQTALTDPVLSTPEVVVEDFVPAEEPVAAKEALVVEVPVAEAVVDEPAFVEAPAAPAFEPAEAPVFAASVFEPAPSPAAVAPVRPRPRFESMWGGTPAPTPLWGEPAPTSSAWTPLVGSPIWGEPTAAPVTSDAPIWGEVASTEDSDDIVDTVPAEEVVAEEILAEEVVAEEVVAEDVEEAAEVAVAESAVEETVEEELAEAEIAELAPLLARTASDPAPMMSLDSTTVMPPLSLLPPLPSSRGRGRGRPPVPRSSRPAVPQSKPSSSTTPERPEVAEKTEDVGAPLSEAPVAGEAPEADLSPAVEPQPAALPATWALATVTRLPVAPLMAGPDIPELPEDAFDRDALFPPVSTPAAVEAPAAPSAPAPSGVAGRLERLGLSRDLLAGTFDDDITGMGVYAALTRSLALNLPQAPEVPSGPGETLFVVGPGVDALRAARSLAASLHLDPDRVQWATRGDLAGLAPSGSRITTVDTAIDRRQDALTAGSVTIVAVDAPLRTDAYWMAQMIAIWKPVAVWGVVEATRKPEDLEPWIAGLPQLDALIVQDTDLSADPAAVLRRVATPVAVVDGVRATPHRWASLLCERMEDTQA